MGRYLKNTQIDSGSYAIQVPVGSSSVGPDSPVDGQMRFNSTNSKIEFYYGSKWNQVAKIGSVQLVVDTFVGDGLTQVFTPMSQSESDPTAIAVFIGGVYQQPTQNYTVSGTAITFTSPPPAPGVNPNQIVIIHNLNSTNAI
jgi:hypothetical protein